MSGMAFLQQIRQRALGSLGVPRVLALNWFVNKQILHRRRRRCRAGPLASDQRKLLCEQLGNTDCETETEDDGELIEMRRDAIQGSRAKNTGLITQSKKYKS
ncbi:hypothetical protein Baya_17164 [Bagarius yarrelli]|uniref:Uncharacterized protein n=1 Tax=Bagarius yarrelli TaxID=175774 RepID=A0A556VXM1_BAGYA|nr:hypothetical protein Baya_17164 [Bagarius yarrelli]